MLSTLSNFLSMSSTKKSTNFAALYACVISTGCLPRHAAETIFVAYVSGKWLKVRLISATNYFTEAKKEVTYVIKCPHCLEDDFKLDDVDPTAVPKHYTDTPARHGVLAKNKSPAESEVEDEK